MDNLIIVSSDSHAGVPKELWPKYLDKRFHELLPQLQTDNEVYPRAIYVLSAKRNESAPDAEHREAQQTGWHGLHDAVLRLADMDREGITAEFIFHGDFRLGDMFHNATNNAYPLDAWDAGARAWNRWAGDNFGFAMERFLVTGAIGSCSDMERTVADLEWIADQRFAGTYGPGYMRHADTPPLFDEYWEPFWSVCEERGLAVVVHAGFGTEQGTVFPQLQRILSDVSRASGGSQELQVLFQHADAITEESVKFFQNFLVNVAPRRPLWQMVFGGVFDRHPNLKLVLTEIRLDWLPETLRYLDAVYDEHRADLPAKRKPSEYWQTNCLGGASFIHKAEVEMRHELGVETILFGRDFPHPEGTWPQTRQWLQHAFAGVPENELRLMLGENAIRLLHLDRDRLAEIAKRIGPTATDILGREPNIPPELVASFDARGGYLKPPEGNARLADVNDLVRQDLAGMGITA
jgi:predicted TIM-barrel fold metal-dependent hydrolase